ncbi:type IV secretory system conjugative DNA transfer family protein [Mycoplasmopsis caviae]|uniref:Conjugal transfer protein traG n=1 Tax=Mycoplasmopsis caviae TaxID=55603 RepID=A0A3P8KAB4_9BACT|nr:type IV secretory system conjugative DNA transfer family protein [Mycoplasmopsis caviae]UUD34835.1 type IV secretory system conjugative DNA transfer family protein [Mycoplasmopsis caviae]VDR42309.1 Conjugal transfer protein traG [Mycoplasmopsis caviae]
MKFFKENRDKVSTIILAILCFILVPILLFFLLGAIGSITLSKDTQLIGNWFSKQRSFINDVMTFYNTSSKIRLYVILTMILGPVALFVFFRWKIIWSWIWSFKNKDELNWTYNQFDNDKSGTFKEFKKQFSNDEPNFIFGYLGPKKGYVVNKTDSHAIVLGIAGSGKTEKILIPNIIRNAQLPEEKRPCFVVTDPKGDILQRTGEVLKENGYIIKLFDLDDPDNSVKWNPLKRVWDIFHSKPVEELTEQDYSDGYGEISELVNSLKWPANGDKDIWVPQAKNLIILILKFLILYSLENKNFELKYFNFSNINKFLNVETFKKGKWIEITGKNKNKNVYWNKLASGISSFINIAPETLTSFLTNAVKVMSDFSNNLIVERITSSDNFELREIISSEKPYAIFIKFPDHKDNIQFLIPILISQVYKTALDYVNSLPSKKLNRPLNFLFEEFNSIGILQPLGNWMSISRSRRIFFLLVLQDYEQLAKYNSGQKEDVVIKSQARLTYFLETNNENTLESFSKMLGDKETTKESKSVNEKSESVTTSTQKERLMSVGEIKYKDPSMMIVLSGGTKPIAIKPIPAWQYLKHLKTYNHQEQKLELDNSTSWNFQSMKIITFGEKEKVENVEEAQIETLDIVDKELAKYKIVSKNIVCIHKNPKEKNE